MTHDDSTDDGDGNRNVLVLGVPGADLRTNATAAAGPVITVA